MGKSLIIAEKPSVAEAIAKALGGFSKMDGWWENQSAVISSGIGHLIELDVPDAIGKNDLGSLPIIPQRFGLRPIDDKRKQYNLVSRLMRRPDVDYVINACDAGREGELIFRLIYEHANSQKTVKRMWLKSMTKEGIVDAHRNLRDGREFDNMYYAARSRVESDWLVGINGSRAITRLYEAINQRYENIALGRVQTPTCTLIVDLENEIRNFIPKEYWELFGTFSLAAGKYTAKWIPKPKSLEDLEKPENEKSETAKSETETSDDDDTGSRMFNLVDAQHLLEKCRGKSPSSIRDIKTVSKSQPPQLYDVTSLQREANTKFKFTAKKTLDIAQALYDPKLGLITYPRTESNVLPDDYLNGEVQDIVNKLTRLAPLQSFAEKVISQNWIVPNKRIFDTSKVTDHFAIIPTGLTPNLSALSDDEKKIYMLIAKRFVAAFFPAAEYNVTKRITVVEDEYFLKRGKVLVNPGWLEVYAGDQAQSKAAESLCAYSPGEVAQNASYELKADKTKPPKRFTEATLLTAMEYAGRYVDDETQKAALKERGLGTGATRAAIIAGLFVKKDGSGRPKEPFCTMESNYIVPTPKALNLIAFLRQNNIEQLTSPALTGEWEKSLRAIEAGSYPRSSFMQEIAGLTNGIIATIRNKGETIPAAAQRFLPSVNCPKCKSARIKSAQRTIECESGCGFKMWREVCHRDISDAEFEKLITHGQIANLDGFVSKSKRKFSAGVELTADWKVNLVFADADAAGADTEPGNSIVLQSPCPKCKGQVSLQGIKFQCTGGSCNFSFYQSLCDRKFSQSEAEELIKNGSIAAVQGFKSTRKKSLFAAGVRFNNDYSKIEFIFNN